MTFLSSFYGQLVSFFRDKGKEILHGTFFHGNMQSPLAVCRNADITNGVHAPRRWPKHWQFSAVAFSFKRGAPQEVIGVLVCRFFWTMIYTRCGSLELVNFTSNYKTLLRCDNYLTQSEKQPLPGGSNWAWMTLLRTVSYYSIESSP